MKRNIAKFCIVLSLFCPALVFANAGTTVRTVDEPSGGGIVNGATFGMVGKANRSYLCAISVGDADYSLSTSITSPSGAPITGIRASSALEAAGYLDRIVGSAMTDVDLSDNLVFFVAPSGAAEYGKYTFTIGVNSGAPSSFSAECVETSIICDYNTYLSQLDFLEVTSLGAKAGTANLKVVHSDGSETPGSFTLTFPAGLRRDVDIHSLAGANSYGSVIIQAIDFVPSFDGFTSPKMSIYKNGELRSSVQCTVPAILIVG